MSNEYKQINIRMNKKIVDWYQKESDELGISRSSLIVMALKTYIDQQQMLVGINTLKDVDENKQITDAECKEK